MTDQRELQREHQREPRLGVDIGRVLIDGSAHPDGGDTAFFQGDEATMLATPEMAGAFDAVADLTRAFGGRVWLVSKCGERVQQRTLRWLAWHRFPERTGVPLDNVRFCRARPQKRLHCVDLGLTHFVDDKPDVHEAIADVVPNRYLFGPQRGGSTSGATPVLTWADARPLILATLERSKPDPHQAGGM